METIRILNLVFGLGGILLLFAIAYSKEMESHPGSRKIFIILFILGNLFIIGSLAGKYYLGHDTVTSFVLLAVADYSVLRSMKKEQGQQTNGNF